MIELDTFRHMTKAYTSASYTAFIHDVLKNAPGLALTRLIESILAQLPRPAQALVRLVIAQVTSDTFAEAAGAHLYDMSFVAAHDVMIGVARATAEEAGLPTDEESVTYLAYAAHFMLADGYRRYEEVEIANLDDEVVGEVRAPEPLQPRRTRTAPIRRALSNAADVLLYVSMTYGIVRACIAFFQVEVCRGVGNCYWFLDGFHWAIVALIFICVFLPISPFLSIYYSWPTYVLGTCLKLLALVQFRRREKPHLIDPDLLESDEASAQVASPPVHRRPWYATAFLSISILWAIYLMLPGSNPPVMALAICHMIGVVATLCWQKWGIYLLMGETALLMVLYFLSLLVLHTYDQDTGGAIVAFLGASAHLCLLGLAIYPLRKQM